MWIKGSRPFLMKIRHTDQLLLLISVSKCLYMFPRMQIFLLCRKWGQNCASNTLHLLCLSIYLVPRVEISFGIKGMPLVACPPSPPSHSTDPNIHTLIHGLVWPLSILVDLSARVCTIPHTLPSGVALLYIQALTLSGLWTSEQASTIPL